jgi:DNA-binding LacI/PurR family transcriptional regulator
VSIIGYHNLPAGDRIAPPLTSIFQPREELGRIAAEILVAILDSGQAPAPRRIAPTLVVRKSTGPAPKLR